MAGKPTLKDAQVTIRLNSELLEQMKNDARNDNLSIADFVVKLYQAYKEGDDVQSRLEALERAVFHQSQIA
jgi:predicted DNA binding CopG/RHH family protein